MRELALTGQMLLPTDRPLVYVHPAVVPAPVANSVQVVSMCEAFGRIHPDVRLAAMFDPRADLAAHYGVAETFGRLQLTGPHRRGSGAFRAVTEIVRRLGRTWSCYTRVAPIAAATSLLGIPTIVEVHALPDLRRHREALRIATRRNALRRMVVISDRLRVACLDERLSPPEKLLVAHDAVRPPEPDDRDVGELRAEFGLPRDVPIVGYAGSLKADKGVNVLLDAVEAHDRLHAAIVGGKPDERFRALQARYAGPRVHFLGLRPPGEVPAFLRACDVIAGPFVRDANLAKQSRMTRAVMVHEYMSPLKVFEAFASGRPFVVSDLPVLREVIEPEHNCVAVPSGDADALRKAIDRLLADPELGRRLARSAQATLATFTWDTRARTILDVPSAD